MAKAYMTSLPNTTDTGRGFIKTVDTPRVPAMDYRSGFKDVGTAIDNTNKFLGEFSQMKYEGFQADLDRLELEHLHEMQDATDPCDLEDINKKWQKNYDTALKDDIWSRSYYKSSFYKKWQDRNQKAQQQIYYAKQHEFAEICATDTLNKMAETASLLDNPADVQQYIENANAMLANTKHLTAEAKYKLMTNFYKDTVSRLYDSDPNKAVAFLDSVGNKYDGYGVSSEEIRKKADSYNKAKQREAELDYKRNLALQKVSNDIELGKLAAKLVTGEAGIDDIKEASARGLFETNPYKEAQMYKSLKDKETINPKYQNLRQLVRTNQFNSVSDLIDFAIDEGLSDTETGHLISLYKNKNPENKPDKNAELKQALKNYNDKIETAEDNEKLYFNGERSKNVYEEIKKIYTTKEKEKIEKITDETAKLAYKGTLTQEFLDEAVEQGLPADEALKYKNTLTNEDEAIDKQLEEIDRLNETGELDIKTLRKGFAKKEYSQAAFNYGSSLIKEKEEAEKQREIDRKALLAKTEKERKEAEAKAKEEQKKAEAEKKQQAEKDDFIFLKKLIDDKEITKESQITSLEFGKKPINTNASKKAREYLKEINAEKIKNKEVKEKQLQEEKRKQQNLDFLDDLALARIGKFTLNDLKEGIKNNRYATQKDIDTLKSQIKEKKEKAKKTITETKNTQTINYNSLRDEGENLALLQDTTVDSYENYIDKVEIAAADKMITGKQASDLILNIAVPQMETRESEIEKYGVDYVLPWKEDIGYFALKPFINEQLGKEKKRPKEGKSSADERKKWDENHTRRAIFVNEIYALYDAALDNLARENNLKSKTEILELDEERRSQLYDIAVQRTKDDFIARNYPDYQNDGKGTALISENEVVRFGKPQNLPNALEDKRFVSVAKSQKTGRYSVTLSDGTRKEITEEEYKRLGGK